MKSRKLGSSGLEVSALGFGAMGLSFPNAPTKEESHYCPKKFSQT
jgi:aryl-alcohol dehydrogenase-like predicted oxidoreductase